MKTEKFQAGTYLCNLLSPFINLILNYKIGVQKKMKSKKIKGQLFYKQSYHKDWRQIFEESCREERKQYLQCLHCFEREQKEFSYQDRRELRQFIQQFEQYCQKYNKYQQEEARKEYLRQILQKTRKRNAQKPINRIKEPQKKYRLPSKNINVRNRSRSSQRNVRLFECIFKICPQLKKARGSNRRYNPRKSEKSIKKQKKNKGKLNNQKSQNKRRQKSIKQASEIMTIIPSQKQGSDQTIQ